MDDFYDGWKKVQPLKKSLKKQEKIVLNQHKNDGNRKKTWQIMQNKWNTSIEFRVVCANSRNSFLHSSKMLVKSENFGSRLSCFTP